MTRFLVFLLAFLPIGALAQSNVTLGGADQRVSPLESQYLSQEVANTLQQLAKVMAMLTVEKQDHAATQKALDETAAYWRAWCGKHLGCDLAVPPKAGQ